MDTNMFQQTKKKGLCVCFRIYVSVMITIVILITMQNTNHITSNTGKQKMNASFNVLDNMQERIFGT